MNYNNEIPKYKKKSNKQNKKSKHKHTYKPCLIHEKEDNMYVRGEYCTICGKLNNIILFDTVETDNKCTRMLSEKEFIEKYKHYELKTINSLYKDKSVEI